MLAAALSLLPLLPATASAREKDTLSLGAGLIVNIPHPESDVAQIVEDVAENTLIRGTKEYNKDEFISGAVAVQSTPIFAPWTEGGKVFYKVRTQALDPRNFINGRDLGTVAVRYIVQPQGEKNTVVRINALFVEDFRRNVHQSDGSVENAEYKDIQDRLEALELIKEETAEAERIKEERTAKQKFGLGNRDDTILLSTPKAESSSRSHSISGLPTPGERAASEAPEPAASSQSTSAQSATMKSAIPPSSSSAAAPLSASSASAQPIYDASSESIEQHVAELRRQVERLVKKPGAPLKAAPFHTANTLKSLNSGAEVLIMISTPYWVGVETHDGDHGWLLRDQLEQLP